MNNQDLQELQNYGLDILKIVDEFCKKNNIKYSLGEGTLLGCIRHNGFIPWDDDIDIYMLREDFNKFVNSFKHDDYRVEYFNTIPNYWLPFAKVRLLKETKFITPSIVNILDHTGPRIDIFPLDNVIEQESIEQDKIFKKVKFWESILRNKVLPINKKKKLILYLAWPISKLFPYKYIVNKVNKYMTYYNNIDCKYVANTCGSYHIRKETFPRYYFEELINHQYEDTKLPVSKYYDEVLTKIYGNYMELPKKEERFVKHDIIVKDGEK